MAHGHPSRSGGATMRYAYVDGEKVEPTKGAKGICLACDGQVLAKCGKIKVHHWAHRAGECDPWAEPMSDWHRAWQDAVKREHVEVVRKPHRADIVGEGGTVIELQHSSIDPDTIAAREAFYGNMVWLFDATERFRYFCSGSRAFFTLERHKHIPFCTKPVYFDFGDAIIEVERFVNKKFYDQYDGYGLVRDHSWFLDTLVGAHRDPALPFRHPPFRADCDRRQWRAVEALDRTRKYHDKPHLGPWHVSTVELGKLSVAAPIDLEHIFDELPELAGGWTRDSLAEVMDCFTLQGHLTEGSLFVYPNFATERYPALPEFAGPDLIGRLDAHADAGRMAPLSADARQSLHSQLTARDLRRATTPPMPPPSPSQGLLF